jgi:hypothetical protein
VSWQSGYKEMCSEWTIQDQSLSFLPTFLGDRGHGGFLRPRGRAPFSRFSAIPLNQSCSNFD